MRVLIVRNNYNAKSIDAAMMLSAFLATQGVDCDVVDSSSLAAPESCEGDPSASEYGLAVVLGGDGTILRTARYVGTKRVPIIGINFGNLGFLANSSEEGVIPLVVAALSDDVVREERTSLRIDVICEGDQNENEGVFVDDGVDARQGARAELRGENGLWSSSVDFPSGERDDAAARKAGRRSFFALNEAAFARGERGRIVSFKFAIAGSPIASMRGDGLVVATATGSTAYALSAGGPLVAPTFGGLVVVPIAPHTLQSRAIVTAPSDIVEVELSENAAGREAALFVDGEPIGFESRIVRALVRKNAEPTTLLRYKHEGFYAHASHVFFRS